MLDSNENDKEDPRGLRRELGLVGAVIMGLGSILGTGVFVSIAIAAGITGPSVVLAIVVAALVATCNALSSAQLAAHFPVSGGTYEYGYRLIHPSIGFLAGWLFLCAKSASAAAAAMGVAIYLSNFLNFSFEIAKPVFALAAVIGFTTLAAIGLKLSTRVNIAIVATTIISLLTFVATGLFSQTVSSSGEAFFNLPDDSRSFFHAAALMFVAYTGYGRIATLGEEVRDPAKTIPKAIIVTMVVAAFLYVTVAASGIRLIGSESLRAFLDEDQSPLVAAVEGSGYPAVGIVLSIGAVTAMLAVLLNLILGLSRVVLAMGRRGDLPQSFAQVNEKSSTPVPAVVLVGTIVGSLALSGNIKLAWSFSAVTVLVYYAITNIAALRLPVTARLYPRWISVVGLVSCITLALFVEWQIWIAAGIVAFAGLGWHSIRRMKSKTQNTA